MFHHATRRTFLQAGAAGALMGLGDLSFLSKLRPVSADEANVDPKVVQLRPEIEPLVRLLEGGVSRKKILDYFPAGVPVISTAKGIEGIPVKNGREALIIDDFTLGSSRSSSAISLLTR